MIDHRGLSGSAATRWWVVVATAEHVRRRDSVHRGGRRMYYVGADCLRRSGLLWRSSRFDMGEHVSSARELAHLVRALPVGVPA